MGRPETPYYRDGGLGGAGPKKRQLTHLVAAAEVREFFKRVFCLDGQGMV